MEVVDSSSRHWHARDEMAPPSAAGSEEMRIESEQSRSPPPNESARSPSPALPPYSPSGSTPPYSYNPQADERRLAITTRAGARGHPLRTGVFRVASKRAGIVLMLHNQEEGVSIPSFGRNALISGTIELTSNEGVVRVEVELEGHLRLTIAEGGKKTRNLFNVEHTIWQRDGAASHRCPRTLNFIVPMPNSYSVGTASRPLPPSYQVIFPGVPGLFANSVYSITVRVKRSRKVLWSHNDSINTPIKYYPRTRAPRAIMKHTLSFFSLLKIAPEEFFQVESTVQTRAGSGFAPIHCLLFIPSSCIYAMTDEIPFHLQLVAPLTSLVALCAPHALSLSSSGASRTSAIAQLQSSFNRSSSPLPLQLPLTSSILLPSGTGPSAPAGASPNQGHSGASLLSATASTFSASLLQNLNTLGASLSELVPSRYLHLHLRSRLPRPTIRVFLLRQITVEVRGQKAWRTCVLGEGVLTPCPPGPDAGCTYPYPYPYRRPSSSSSVPQSSRPSFMVPRRRESCLSTTATNANTNATEQPDLSTSTSTSASACADPIDALNWSGTVRVASPSSIQVGGFAASALGLVVKDFVVLSVVPPDPSRSPLIEHQHAQPIRLVTDPLVEEEGGM